MAHDAAILKDIRKAVEAQDKKFKELPKLKQWIELARQYQGTGLRAKRREIGLDYNVNGYALNADGRVIGLQLDEVQLPDYTVIQELRRLNYLRLSGTREDWLDKTFVQKGLAWLRGAKPFEPFSDLTPLTSLSALIMLNVSSNQIRDLMPLTGLSALTTLAAWNNQIRDLMPLAGLSVLTELYLRGNQINDLMPLTGLSALTAINVGGNQISNLTPLAGLTALTKLDLGRNQISDLTQLVGLSALIELKVSSNQISDLTPLVGLTQVKSLNLRSNHITVLPKALTESGLEIYWKKFFDSSRETGINLYDNPLETPPPEVVKEGMSAIRNYFRQLETVGHDYLYEAKLLIVGEPGAGKTTLAKKILDPAYQLDNAEVSTKGIDVLRYEFPLSPFDSPSTSSGQAAQGDGHGERSRTMFRVNIWDFGGQEIYHATHQFFLTKRSLYILVADTRKEDTDFYYWLKVVELLCDNSPVLIVKNEKQDRVREINERQLRGQFTNLKETLETNLATNRGLEAILDHIRHYISHLPHVGATLPKTWVKVREMLERDVRNYVSLDEYFRVCAQHGFEERQDQLQLSGYLHDLGVCLHFQDDPLLRKTVILKPEWGTAAVYKVLDNPTVQRKLGKFTRADLADIWHEAQYADMRDELLQLMMKFQLCYAIQTAGVQTSEVSKTSEVSEYIAPQLLTENQPEYAWDASQNLLLRYSYEFMPKGILTRFIVATHPLIEAQRYVWRSGVILRKDETKAEVIEYYGKREIMLRVAGKHKRDLLTTVMYELDKIHAAYTRLKYDKLIPCNCATCKESQERYFYPFDELREFLASGQRNIQCRKRPFHMVNVRQLLDDAGVQAKGMDRPRERREQQKYHDLQAQWDLVHEKLAKLGVAYALETQPTVKFQLEKQIAEVKTERAWLEIELREAENDRDYA